MTQPPTQPPLLTAGTPLAATAADVQAIKAAIEQPLLFDESQLPLGHELLTIEDDEKRGRFSGERVKLNRERYALIVRSLGQGLGIRQIARALRVSPGTVQGVRDREGLWIGAEKKELSHLMGHFTRIAVERLIEEVDSIPIGQLSVSVGIISDKKGLLDGDPTVRIEHSDAKEITPEAIRDMFERLRRAGSVDVSSTVSEPNPP